MLYTMFSISMISSKIRCESRLVTYYNQLYIYPMIFHNDCVIKYLLTQIYFAIIVL